MNVSKCMCVLLTRCNLQPAAAAAAHTKGESTAVAGDRRGNDHEGQQKRRRRGDNHSVTQSLLIHSYRQVHVHVHVSGDFAFPFPSLC